MLSFLFRLVRDFQATHGYQPNTLFISPRHYRSLQQSVPGLAGNPELSRFLAVDIILSETAVHPHMAWLIPATARYATRHGGC